MTAVTTRSEPVFSETAWTGQPMTKDEYVLCPVCQDQESLIGLRGSAWFDHYNQQRYVHFGCLSEQRKRELADMKD